jgi:hypothetical protein
VTQSDATPGGGSGVSPTPRSPFLVVAMHKVRDRSAAVPWRWLPYGVEHAWRPGSRTTLCGQWMGDWPVFWERSFVVTTPEACPDCVEATLPPDSRSRLDPRRPAVG